jgi:hypothetical protein
MHIDEDVIVHDHLLGLNYQSVDDLKQALDASSRYGLSRRRTRRLAADQGRRPTGRRSRPLAQHQHLPRRIACVFARCPFV